MNPFEKYNQQAREWLIHDFQEFRQRLHGQVDAFVEELKDEALQHFQEMGFPHPKNEEWKYTNLLPLLQHRFTLVSDIPETETLHPEQFDLIEGDVIQLVFVNGVFSGELSRIPRLHSGVIIQPLQQAWKEHPQLVAEYLPRGVDFRKQTFPALNTAFSQDGYFIYIPENTHFDVPVHLLYLAHPGDVAFHVHPRNILIVGKEGKVELLESHVHLSDYPYFHNSLTTTFVGEGARVEHIRFQDAASQAFLMGHTAVFQDAASQYTSLTIDLGGRLVRNDLTVHLQGEEATTVLNGFYLTTGRQHVDNHTIIEHEVPRCQSNELYKGILTDQSRAVFSGLIRVHKDAQKTNAFQSNRNLLLSREAEVDTKPQLIIYADDVKCSHGATVGQMNEEAVFYMQQRGIPEAEARALLRLAFGAETLQVVSRRDLRQKLEEIISQRLQDLPETN